MAVNGITITPIRRSVTARPDNIMLEGFCSSFLCFIARIINAFRRIVGIRTLIAVKPKTKSKSEFLNDTCGSNGQ